MISYLTPLVVILSIRFFEEIFDEINRYKRDRKINLEEYLVFDEKQGDFEQKKSQDIREGDIIKIFNQRVPADVIILKSK